MWHNLGYEEIVSNDYRAGRYLVYDIDTFDYIVNEHQWVVDNNAFEEWSYIMDYMEFMLESEDGELVYIPDAKTATRLETEREIFVLENTLW